MSDVIHAPMGLEGRLVTEVVAPNGEVLHRVEQPNILTDLGLENLHLGLDDMTGWAAIGDRADAPDVGDRVFGGSDDLSLEKAYIGVSGGGDCATGTIPPQVRSIRARSGDNGGFTREINHADDWTWGEVTRYRQFKNTNDYFVLRDNPPSHDEEDWDLDQEADILTELSFLRHANLNHSNLDCGGGVFLQWSSWNPGPILNRVLLKDEQDTPTSYGWNPNGGADVILASNGILRFTYTFRVYLLTTPVEQTLTINGTQTTVRTRAVDVNHARRFGSYGIQYFGQVQDAVEATKAGVREDNTMPSNLLSGVQIDEKFNGVQVLGHGPNYTDRAYIVQPGSGLMPGGIGSITHGAMGPIGNSTNSMDAKANFLTTFDPPIPKTDLEKVTFNVRYSWSRR